MAKLIVVGVGPGDPELITLKAAKALKKAPCVVVPKSKSSQTSSVRSLVDGFIGINTKVIELDFSMGGSETVDIWKSNAGQIAELLKEGDVVYALLGDPLFYGTIINIMPYLNALTDIEVEVVPGITSVSALASETNTPIVQGSQSLGVCSMTMPMEELKAVIECFDNIVVMKVSVDPENLKSLIEEFGLEKNFLLGVRVGMDDSCFSTNLSDLTKGLPYFSTVFIKKGFEFDGRKT